MKMRESTQTDDAAAVAARVSALEWSSLEAQLVDRGWSTTGPLLTAAECAELAAGFDDTALFRSRVVMARHGYGRGEYKYYGYPLPPVIGQLRAALYPRLTRVANHWSAVLRRNEIFPNDHREYIERCHQAGQTRPTPLLLRYAKGDYNCLHQDLYGELSFPLQTAILLSEPERDFTGGEFILTEQRPRMQSRVEVVPLRQGEGVVFAVNHRPVQGTRGAYRVTMRHGVSQLRSGQRYTLGIIFHDAT
jgi:hypothetical protein